MYVINYVTLQKSASLYIEIFMYRYAANCKYDTCVLLVIQQLWFALGNIRLWRFVSWNLRDLCPVWKTKCCDVGDQMTNVAC